MKHLLSSMAIILIAGYSLQVRATWYTLGDTSSLDSYELLESSFAYAHPGNPLQTQNNTVLVAAPMGVDENQDVAIRAFRKPWGGSWSVVTISDVGDYNDPTFIQTTDGTIYCYYFHRCCDDEWVRTSTDDGLTWSDEIDVGVDTKQIGEQNNPKQHPNGDYMSIFGYPHAGAKGQKKYTMFSTVKPTELTNNAGWETVTIRDGEWGTGDILILDHNDVVNGHYRKLAAILRCDFTCNGNQDGQNYAYSSDAGKSWTTSQLTANTSIVDADVCGEGNFIFLGGTTRSTVSMGIGPGDGKYVGWHVIATASRLNNYYKCFAGDQNQAKAERAVISINVSSTGANNDWKTIFAIRDNYATTENCDPGIIEGFGKYAGKLLCSWTGRQGKAMRYMVIDKNKLIASAGGGATVSSAPASLSMRTASIAVSPGANGVRHIHYAVPAPGAVHLAVLDARGKQMWRHIEQASAGENTCTWHPGNTVPGMYFIALDSQDQSKVTAAMIVE
ncbi:MAG: hypothetical protein GF398_04360 [Chitinivibrionales bacterium]|nr:hypothetical protein [Chitinivibrionales bacterium]